MTIGDCDHPQDRLHFYQYRQRGALFEGVRCLHCGAVFGAWTRADLLRKLRGDVPICTIGRMTPFPCSAVATWQIIGLHPNYPEYRRPYDWYGCDEHVVLSLDPPGFTAARCLRCGQEVDSATVAAHIAQCHQPGESVQPGSV